MAAIEFDRTTQDTLARLLVKHLKDKLDLEVARFDAIELLDFLSEALGPYYYNQGLADAQAIVQARAEDVVEALYGIEKPVKI